MESADRWFVCHTRRPDADVQLFCLPYAGAGASAYRGWSAVFGPEIEIVAVQLPGRESRIRDPLVIDPPVIAEQISARADRPFAIFGHSLGGRLGFEVIRSLRRAGKPLPLRLYPSASRSPDENARSPLDGLSRLDDDTMLARLAEAGGFPAAVLAEPELVALVLPVLRADLTWVDDYTYTPEPPLEVPIIAFAGETDEGAPPSRMAGWQRHTTAGGTLHTFPGGHFFVHERLPEVARLIQADLLAPTPS